MVKLGLLVAVGAIGAALSFPISEEDQASDGERELQLRQGGILAAVLGQIGTSLVPVVGAVLGPILTNLASGISEAFNNGLNPTATSAAPTKEESPVGSEASGLVVRIPPDSPLYAFLLAHPSLTLDKDGLPSVGPGPGPAGVAQKPALFSGKFAAAFHPDTSVPAPVHVDDRDSVTIDSSDDSGREEEDEEEKFENPNVKRYPQRVRTETKYA